MPNFKVRVTTRQGLRDVEVIAASKQEASKMVGKMGQVVSVSRNWAQELSPGLSPDERQIFFMRLSTMLSSRVGAGAALALMRDTFSGRIKIVAQRLLNFLESGDDLPAALEKVGSPDFPPTTVAMIQAGSKSGETWRAVRDAAGFEYELFKARQGASKGLASGIFGFVVAGVTTVASTLYVGPKIMDSPLIKTGIDASSKVVIDNITVVGNIMGVAMAVLMGIFLLFVLLGSVGRRIMPLQADKLILKIPYYKDLVLARNNFITMYGLSLLVRSGVRTEEALRLTAVAAPKGALRQDLNMAYDAVRNGKPWPAVMTTLHPTDKAALMSSSDREQIADTLQQLATQYRELYAQRIAGLVPIIQMIAALFLSLSGGILFGEAILPMLMMGSSLG